MAAEADATLLGSAHIAPVGRQCTCCCCCLPLPWCAAMLLAVVAGPPTYTPPEIIASRLPTADRLLPNKAGVLRGASIWLVCTAAAAVAGVIEERAAIAAN